MIVDIFARTSFPFGMAMFWRMQSIVKALEDALFAVERVAPREAVIPMAVQSLALAHTKRGDTASAIPLMRRALELAPNGPGSTGMMQRLASFVMESEPAEAAELLRKVVAQPSQNSPAVLP